MGNTEYFQSLIAGGADVSYRAENRNRRAHHTAERIYHGPMAIPERVAAIIAEHPSIKRTTDRHYVHRYADGAWTWIFRAPIPESRLMVGEIVRPAGMQGYLRVHCWALADPARYTPERREEPAAIVARIYLA